MSLKSAQLATLRAHIDSVPAWAALPNDSESAATIAAALNAPASPTFYVYRTSVPADEVMDAIVWANFTPAPVPDSTALWTNRSLACQGKQFNVQTMLVGRSAINPSKANIRAGLQDALTDIPSGNNGNMRQGGWAAVAALLYRTATVAEMVLSTGAGTTAAPAKMGHEGDIGYADVQSARSL